jgi:1,3-beta-glucan synthase
LYSVLCSHTCASISFSPLTRPTLPQPTTLHPQNPGLRVAFLDARYGGRGRQTQHAVLVRARLGTPVEDPASTEELYRLRLPVNHATGQGVILGEGKPENQNAAIPFCFGEALQAIDMNQDNYLCEAVKMRNLIAEFNPPSYSPDAWAAATSAGAKRAAGAGAVAIPARGDADATAPAAAALSGAGLRARGGAPADPRGAPPGAVAYERPFPDAARLPVALVGFREWIFSQDSGALASFAAATEFTFGSIIQRVMTWPGGVRYHYGHPDLWNKLFVMTRGGVSKATRGFHISEDVFAGYNAALRGGRVKFKEYICCGKGRDMGFDSINSFESKVSSGNGEQVMSRDIHRLGARLDFFRLLSLYHSGPGFFLNTYLVLLSVYANMWMLTMLALTDTQTLPNPDDPTTTISTITGDGSSVAVQQIIQIGMLSIVTYGVEMILEYGAAKALATLLVQIVQGSLAFFVFRARTTAFFFLSDVRYGGAKYISTGRGYALRHQPFVKVYSNYARSHLYYAFELLLLLILLSLLAPQSYAASTWSTWLVCVSILWAPFWFNPGSFQLEKTKDDFEAWLLWMGDVVDPETKSTWASWSKAGLEKPRNDRGGATNAAATALRGVLGALPTAVLTLGAVTNLEETRWNKWAVFGVVTAALWLGAALAAGARQALVRGRHYRAWRLVRMLFGAALIAFFVLVCIYAPEAGSGVGLKNLVLILFANFSLAVVLAQTLLYLGAASLPLRSLVDAAYRGLDYLLGYFLFLFLFLLSFLLVFDRVQGALLYNLKFLGKLQEARALGSSSYMASYVDRATERIAKAAKRDAERTRGGGTPAGAPGVKQQ